jgi:hypothetical protein
MMKIIKKFSLIMAIILLLFTTVNMHATTCIVTNNTRSGSSAGGAVQDEPPFDPYDYSTFSFDSIQFWVGEGENQAALIIDWYDEKGSNSALVWGYRWDNAETKYGIDMILAVAKADERFMFIGGYSWDWTIGGFGYDITNSGIHYITRGDVTHYANEDGVIDLGGNYDYDGWSYGDPEGHFQAGWMDGYWSYQIAEGEDINFGYSGVGAGSRVLQNNSVDGWGYQEGWDSFTGMLPRMPFVYVPAPQPDAIHVTDVKLNINEKTLFKGGTVQLTATVIPENADNKNVSWTLSNSAIASVSATGLVTTLAEGETYIFAVSEDGNIKDSCLVNVTPAIYTDGVFFVNEDWFGHNNSTVNFLSNDGDWYYKIYQQANQGKQLGCTSQYGTIYGDKFFIVSKQDRDPGASVTGSRLAVADAKTMESLAEFTTIGGADGRSFLGVNEHKGYIGTSNGIYTFDVDNLTIGALIAGTNSNTAGLYDAQIGTMVRAADRVFAVHQRDGLVVINPETDEIETIIKAPKDGSNQRGIGSIVMSKDGNIWLSIASDVSGGGNAEDYMLKLNPYTLDTTRIVLPAGTGVPNSWYAWTADGFCASAQHNKLYWKNNGGWFHSTKIYEYDIETNTLRTIIDLRDGSFESEQNWGIYGAGFRLHPATDDIYVSLFKDFGNQSYKVAQIDPVSGTVTASYQMINNYWFPAMPVFPDNFEPVVSDRLNTEIEIDIDKNKKISIYLGDKITDEDNFESAITKTVSIEEGEDLINVSVKSDSLIVEGLKKGDATVLLTFNSNGKLVSQEISVNVIDGVGVYYDNVSLIEVYPNPTSALLYVTSSIGEIITIHDMSGKKIMETISTSDIMQINISNFATGTYLLNVSGKLFKIVKK